MTLQIPLSPVAEERLRDRAAAAGVDMETYVRQLVENAIKPESSLEEILAPVHAEVAGTGINEMELDGLLSDALSAARHARQARREG